jgi:hypothetical protein
MGKRIGMGMGMGMGKEKGFRYTAIRYTMGIYTRSYTSRL